MSLKFALFENHLTADPDDFSAVIQGSNAKTENDIYDLMVSRGSTVTKAEALSVMEEYTVAMLQLLRDGNSINTPLFNLNLSIQGVFNGIDDSFDRNRHTIKLNISAGVRLKEVTGDVSVEKVKGASPKPDPIYLEDIASSTRNDTVTPSNIAVIRGSRLKFDNTDDKQGIFFIAADGAETKVANVSRNKPSELHFLVPPLAAGEYSVEVRVLLKNTKEIKTGALMGKVSVK